MAKVFGHTNMLLKLLKLFAPLKRPFKIKYIGASLVAQWLRIHLPMQGTRVRAQEDPIYRGATKPVCHNYSAHVPQLPKPTHLEPMLRNKRSHCNEKPAHCNEEQPLLATTKRKPACSNEGPTQPKINK